MPDKKFILFTEIHDTGKTKVFNVLTLDESTILGKVCWYPAWRRYVFFPSANTLFDSKCLKDIAKFINGLMEARTL